MSGHGIDVFADGYQWHIESQRIVDNLLQSVGRHIFAKEGIGHLIGYFLEREVLDVVEKRLRQRFDGVGHEKSLIGSQPLHHSLFECGIGSLTVCTVVFHTK